MSLALRTSSSCVATTITGATARVHISGLMGSGLVAASATLVNSFGVVVSASQADRCQQQDLAKEIGLVGHVEVERLLPLNDC